jgi:hypothetical protein
VGETPLKFLLAVAALLFASPAWAQTHCRGSSATNGRIYDGAVIESRAMHTRSSARAQGRSPWCSFGFNTVGGVKRILLVESPRTGVIINPRKYLVAYRSDTVGQDTFAVRVFWTGNGTRVQSATIRYTVTVVDKPL